MKIDSERWSDRSTTDVERLCTAKRAVEQTLEDRFAIRGELIEEFKTDERGCYFDLDYENKVWMSSALIYSLMREAAIMAMEELESDIWGR